MQPDESPLFYNKSLQLHQMINGKIRPNCIRVRLNRHIQDVTRKNIADLQ